MTTATTKKPWPSDAVMVVAATPEDAVYSQMSSVEDCNCRDCGKALVADGYTINRASHPDLAHGRPVKFFCMECFDQYDMSTVTHHEDHRKHKE